MKSVNLTMPTTIDDRDATVDFNYSPAIPAVMYLRNGDPGYPEEPAEVEVTEIRLGDGNEFDFGELNDDEQKALIEKCHEFAADYGAGFGDGR